ncbi:MAG TPA: hypothetical protein VKY26_06165 [Actinomycetota bacterium]|nr:hypothetical protein [Actinomycetota bacterium]
MVGGGPAGASAAACLARRGWRTALIEASEFGGFRYGETLAPEVNPLLAEAGFAEAFITLAPGYALECPGTVSTWGTGHPSEVDFVANAFGSGWHVDRAAFDRCLFEAAGVAGATLVPGTRIAEVRREPGTEAGSGRGLWRLATAAEPGELRAGFLVVATGQQRLRGLRSSSAGHRRRQIDTLLAVMARVSELPGQLADLRTAVEAAADGWWYSARLPQAGGVVMFFTDAEVLRNPPSSLTAQAATAPRAEAMLGQGRLVEARTLAARSGIECEVAGPGWLAAGDAAAAYDPISGWGVVKALREGIAAAEAVDGHLSGDAAAIPAYGELLRRSFAAYRHRRRAVYADSTRWADNGFWQRRLASTSGSTVTSDPGRRAHAAHETGGRTQ